MSLKDLYKVRFGGTSDTASLSAIGASAMVSSTSALAGQFPGASLALAIMGGTSVGHRMLESWKKKNLLNTSVSIQSATSLIRPDGLLIGFSTDSGQPVYLPDEDLMRHGFILGQSGVGKTQLGKLLMFQQIQRGGGLMFIDGKLNADDIQTIYQYCRWAGREDDFLVLNPGNPEISHTYNPILRGDSDEIAARILSLIPSTENNPGADHYKQSANQGITTLVAALQAAGLAYNFIDFTILLMNHKAIEELETKLKKTVPNHPATKNLSLFLEQYKGGGKPGSAAENMVDIKRMKETFGGVGGRMYMFGTGKFGTVLNTYTPEIDLFEAIRSKKIIYAALPTMGKNEAASNFGKMLLGDLRTAISWTQALPEAERPNPPFLTFMDEVGSYAVQSLARPFEQARSAAISLFPAAQTLANLEVVSPDFKEMVMGNTWTKIFFKLGTQKSAEEAADLIGMTMAETMQMATSQSSSESQAAITLAPNGNVGDGAGMTTTARLEEKYRVSPDDLKSLDKGECIVLYGGDTVFNIRVPMLTIDKKTAAGLGKLQLAHKRKKVVVGADYFKNSNKYLGGGKQETNREMARELANE
ncbi:type IV secretory system conjugative DNA transfer family protein [Noviherbaspirillum pedocola]|uniref:Type IV secretion system DNA-binding domain-containing protein n=1 Tax=Noviherbaspirillum pedocola TaxID=2801341 RepID=A0A934SY21_9BURK|nr:type IV secretion system DNA-binding domain-containing protein [Noviherbaspirillum pedocola]MBK4737842.1 type IV secretion system DNA-binding domain-containing protein [Noviherbaspirillum pedocola]